MSRRGLPAAGFGLGWVIVFGLQFLDLSEGVALLLAGRFANLRVELLPGGASARIPTGLWTEQLQHTHRRKNPRRNRHSAGQPGVNSAAHHTEAVGRLVPAQTGLLHLFAKGLCTSVVAVLRRE